ncbi:GSCOCT00014339001.2-RA-CDS [Cotesia congregata]|uniref:Uncharacterized protein n=1 Tax=Cotesia congregata TaxID=51543 RepID=S6D4Y8_COTCN|nr:GSCOCT00014339001.2-RA-CDS [Cotesia congregata]CCQ71392.1 hypothetical protein CcBV_21.1 [Cotesia congregata]
MSQKISQLPGAAVTRTVGSYRPPKDTTSQITAQLPGAAVAGAGGSYRPSKIVFTKIKKKNLGVF